MLPKKHPHSFFTYCSPQLERLSCNVHKTNSLQSFRLEIWICRWVSQQDLRSGMVPESGMLSGIQGSWTHITSHINWRSHLPAQSLTSHSHHLISKNICVKLWGKWHYSAIFLYQFLFTLVMNGASNFKNMVGDIGRDDHIKRFNEYCCTIAGVRWVYLREEMHWILFHINDWQFLCFLLLP